jgi:hypothetical protein
MKVIYYILFLKEIYPLDGPAGLNYPSPLFNTWSGNDEIMDVKIDPIDSSASENGNIFHKYILYFLK